MYFLPAIFLIVALYISTLFYKKYLAAVFLVGFVVFISPVLFFSDRVSSYYAYIPAIFLFLSFEQIADFVYGKIKGIKIKPYLRELSFVVVTLGLFLYVFNTDKVLMDDCFLIKSPWYNQSREQFLRLVSDIDKFESSKDGVGKFNLEEKSKDLVLDNGVDVVKPFLSKQTANLFLYTLSTEQTNLIVTKK
jgi:hypothetical protein